jgi:hypothetical protein
MEKSLMSKDDVLTELEKVSDQNLFEAVARRLQRIYKKTHGMDFKFGCFEWIFHDGRFQGIEEKPRNKVYWGFKFST